LAQTNSDDFAIFFECDIGTDQILVSTGFGNFPTVNRLM